MSTASICIGRWIFTVSIWTSACDRRNSLESRHCFSNPTSLCVVFFPPPAVPVLFLHFYALPLICRINLFRILPVFFDYSWKPGRREPAGIISRRSVWCSPLNEAGSGETPRLKLSRCNVAAVLKAAITDAWRHVQPCPLLRRFRVAPGSNWVSAQLFW